MPDNRLLKSSRALEKGFGVRLVMISAMLALLTEAGSAQATEYRLGPQDQIRIKAYEWRASRDLVFEWTALNDVFMVNAEGAVSLPLAGQVTAEGLTTGELASAIAENLMSNMGLGRKPDMAVEIAQFRPFYIVGAVDRPGEFNFRPDLTLLQAVSIAGGLRSGAENFGRSQREVIQGRGDVNIFATDRVNLVARKARLEAELSDAEELAFPTELISRELDVEVARVLNQERSLFQARRQRLDTQTKALNSLRSFLEKEVSSVQAQLELLDKQIALVQAELEGVSDLVQKGLATAPREFSLERALAQIQSERLTAETSLLRSRQELSRTDISLLDLQDGRRSGIGEAIRETQSALDALDRRTVTAMELLDQAELSAARMLAESGSFDQAEPAYTIFRRSADGTVETIAATEMTGVQPGDTIRVEIRLRRDNQAWITDPASMAAARSVVTLGQGLGADDIADLR